MNERVRLQDLDPPDRTQLSPDQVLEAGQGLLEYFDVAVSPDNPQEFGEALRQLDPRYQGERTKVRYELEQDQTSWSEEAVGLIMQSAEDLRMLKPQTPLEGPFDMVISLGGARQSNMDRMRYAARCLFTRASLEHQTAQGLRLGSLIVAGSERALRPSEKENVSNYAPGAKTEKDLVMATYEQIEAAQAELIREYGKHPQIHGFGAVIAEGEKVGTPDVVSAVLGDLVEGYGPFPEDFRLGAVTTQIYQVATALDVARAARKYGITETFVAGNPSDPKIVESRTPATYLSELSKAFRVASLAKAEGIDKVGMKEYPIRPYGFDYYV